MPLRRIALAALSLAVLALAAPAAGAQVAVTEASCATNGGYSDGPPAATVPNGRVAWPADDPLWEFDVYRPANRTTVNGGGVEIRNVTYRGRKVLDRASVPVLNVEYDEGGCGCFRDWQTEEAPVEVGPGAVVVAECGAVAEAGEAFRSGIALSAPGAVQASCEANAAPDNARPGGDVGDFVGLAVEDYGDELVVTGHSRAGWYRYRMKWHFYSDGRIWPEFSFAAATAVCTETAHRHHAYWRFDFDLDGTASNDVVQRVDASGATVVTEEAEYVLAGEADPTYWRITDGATGIGYEIVPGDADKRLSADDFSKIDALVLRYKMDEVEDGIIIGGGCAFEYEPFLDGESIENEDSVFWVRSGAFHTAGAPFECDLVGPMLRPVGFEVSTPTGPRGAEIEPSRPNPFQRTTTTRFRTSETGAVTAELYDLTGRRVRVLFDGTATGGEWQSLRIDGRDLPAGTYVVRLRGAGVNATSRVVLVR